MALTPDDRRRLIGVLSMLSSDKDGERSAAGLAATRIMTRLNLQWDAIIIDDRPVVAPQRSAPPPRPRTWRDAAMDCQERENHLTEWEAGFLRSILRRSSLTAKQATTLRSICERLGVR